MEQENKIPPVSTIGKWFVHNKIRSVYLIKIKPLHEIGPLSKYSACMFCISSVPQGAHFTSEELRELCAERMSAWPLWKDLWTDELGFLPRSLICPQFLFIHACVYIHKYMHHVHTSTVCINAHIYVSIYTRVYTYMCICIYVAYIMYNLLIRHCDRDISQLRFPLSR